MKKNKLICKVYRGSSVESIHRVQAYVISDNNKTIFQTDETNVPVCVRSTLKPFQLAAGLKAGLAKKYNFTMEEIAFMSSSHNGEEVHTNIAKKMLEKFNIFENEIRCGTHPPYDKQTRKKIIENKTSPTCLHNNCSGKHIFMILLKRFLENQEQQYEKLDNEVQQKILEYIKMLVQKNPDSIGIDGCSAPTPFYPLKTISQLFYELAKQDREELKTIYKAISANPYILAGKNRFDTEFIKTVSTKAITMVGGEAVRGIAIRDGARTIGIALKVEDGNQRACGPAALHLMKHLDLINNKNLKTLQNHFKPSICNHNKIETGIIKCQIVEEKNKNK